MACNYIIFWMLSAPYSIFNILYCSRPAELSPEKQYYFFRFQVYKKWSRSNVQFEHSNCMLTTSVLFFLSALFNLLSFLFSTHLAVMQSINQSINQSVSQLKSFFILPFYFFLNSFQNSKDFGLDYN